MCGGAPDRVGGEKCGLARCFRIVSLAEPGHQSIRHTIYEPSLWARSAKGAISVLRYRRAGGAQGADPDRSETRRRPCAGRVLQCSEGAGLVNTARQDTHDFHEIDGRAPLMLAGGGRIWE